MDGLRDDLEKALATVDTELGEDTHEPAEAREETQEASPLPDEGAVDKSPAEEGSVDEPQLAEAVGDSEAEKPPASKDSIKPPINWSPKAREEWKNIPRHVQETIANREKDIASNMANTKQARQVYDTIGQMAQSYAPIMAAEGVNDPMQAIDGMFKTVARLRLGSQEDKVQIIADMIGAYGVDLNSLDQHLAGNAAPQQQQQQQTPGLTPELEAALEQRLAPVNQLLNRIGEAERGQQTKVQEEAMSEVQSFAQNAEFLNDVRMDMADLIDLSTKRGKKMGLKEAYDTACAMNPEISRIIASRGQNSMAQKRHAASSLNGRAAGVGGGNSPASLRDTISAAWDASSHG